MDKRKTAAPAMSVSEEETTYNIRVKKKLIEWRDSFEKVNSARLNYSAIAKKMEEDFHIITSAQKISAMFCIDSKREVKLQEVAALAQIFNIPLQDICEYPNAPASNMNLTKLLGQSKTKQSSIKQLNDSFYAGKYYCYYFKAKHHLERLKPVEESEIEEAEMTISIDNGHTVVSLQEKKANKTFYGEPMPSFTLTGNLYHFENPNMAYSFITDQTGRRAMALMFTYLNLSADIRYYITVAMMTFSLNQTHAPLFQKMAVFRVRQKYDEPEIAEIIRGILALNTCPIIIDEETLDKLFDQDDVVKKIIPPKETLKKCYVFSEDVIRSNSYFLSDENERIQKILQLRKNSLFPAHEIVSEPDAFADFIRQYQCKQLEEGGDER